MKNKFIDSEELMQEKHHYKNMMCLKRLFNQVHKLSALGDREVCLRTNKSTATVWRSENSSHSGIDTMSKLLCCYLEELRYTLFINCLSRNFISAMKSNKNMVIILVDDEELHQYSSSQIILKKVKNKKKK
ncbi:hypothetical protein [uncultured Bacteroides sp.]|uniref:hypothetical protein n=1 Tax=uncultured Bacteroides sp. TaxID=162156 RepID=UPI002AA92A78|nr:hypothetical protein [uncultured Bacteroides sp.]